MTKEQFNKKFNSLPENLKAWFTLDYGQGDWFWTGGSLKERNSDSDVRSEIDPQGTKLD